MPNFYPLAIHVRVPWGAFLILLATGLLLKVVDEESKAAGFVAIAGFILAIIVGYMQLHSWGKI